VQGKREGWGLHRGLDHQVQKTKHPTNLQKRRKRENRTNPIRELTSKILLGTLGKEDGKKSKGFQPKRKTAQKVQKL